MFRKNQVIQVKDTFHYGFRARIGDLFIVEDVIEVGNNFGTSDGGNTRRVPREWHGLVKVQSLKTSQRFEAGYHINGAYVPAFRFKAIT